MADNKQIKDGLGNVFTIRMRDISAAGDGSVQRSMILTSPYPLDYGPGGEYQHYAASGVMAAAMPDNSPIYAFRWPVSTMYALIWRVKVTAWSVTAFAGGFVAFNIYAARSFTAIGSGGLAADLSGNNNKLRTSMASSASSIAYSNTGGMTPGTRTLDAAPMDSWVAPATAAGVPFLDSPMVIFDKQLGEQHPLLLAQNEGFVVTAKVPNDGTWSFGVTTRWDELSNY
ncbi:MAG TPA: hypothetical protein VGH47_04400 [Xanthobacteraceae bacterium]|jgi:hypothetical protein